MDPLNDVDMRRLPHRRIATPYVDAVAVANDDGIVVCDFVDRRHLSAHLRRLPSIAPSAAAEQHLDLLVTQLAGYFAGSLRQFTVPLAPIGTVFRQRAWSYLLAIPFGQTRSYRQQAIALDDANACRAVAGANANNFRSLLIPCHRVIAADGGLGGFGSGVDRKRLLLAHEARHAAG